MRRLLLLLLLVAAAAAEDAIHLRNGRILRGTVVEETESEVVIDLGAGHLRIARDRIRLVERGARPEEPARTVTRRDEWFLVLHREKIAGWQHFVETFHPERVQVQEETVFFRPGGGDDVSVRRVETADGRGAPIEFLLYESYGGEAEVTSGHVREGKAHVRVARGGNVEHRVVDLPEGCTLALPAWTRFLEEARPAESRELTVLDLRLLKPVPLVLRRDEDDAEPPDPRPWRAVTLAADFRHGRSLYRSGEGARTVELNGPTLVARRTTPERVELARKAHAAPRSLGVEEALRYPFVQRPPRLDTHHARAGLSVRAPDAGWVAEVIDADSGRVLCFEKVALFASCEIFSYAAPGGLSAEECLARGLARLRLDAKEVRELAAPEASVVGGLPARSVTLAARHRGEDLRVLLTAVAGKDRYLLVVGAVPARWWRWAEKDFRALAASLEVAP